MLGDRAAAVGSLLSMSGAGALPAPKHGEHTEFRSARHHGASPAYPIPVTTLVSVESAERSCSAIMVSVLR